MHCEQFLENVNEQLAGELPADNAASLAAHLAGCPACQAAALAIRSQDVALRLAFAPHRAAALALAGNVNKQLRAEAAGSAIVAKTAKPRAAGGWMALLLAVAAGFLLAILLFRPWQVREVVVQRAPQPIAQMALATGPVEVRQAAAAQWLACPTSSAIEQGAAVRTSGNAQCEVATTEGNSLRLNKNTELCFADNQTVQLARGQLWTDNYKATAPLAIESANGTIIAEPAAKVDMACSGDQLLVTVVEGEARIGGDPSGKAVKAGDRVTMVSGKITDDRRSYDPLLDTAWVNGLVALKDPASPELAGRVNNMLAQVGAAKLSNLYEDELRRLGDAGVGPLVRYLEATQSEPQQPRRATAARIIADVAQPRWIPDLIALLTDANAEVRAAAAQSLERLTGRNQGLSAAQWQAGPWASCAPAHEGWLRWWNEHRDRYPGAAQQVPAASAPSF